jgi:hypothetical protein
MNGLKVRQNQFWELNRVLPLKINSREGCCWKESIFSKISRKKSRAFLDRRWAIDAEISRKVWRPAGFILDINRGSAIRKAFTGSSRWREYLRQGEW